MNVLGRAAPLLARGTVRKCALDALFRRTAAAFERPAPRLWGLSPDATLRAYAAFTAGAAAASAEGAPGEVAAVRRRLFRIGDGVGRWLRWVLGVASLGDSMAAARMVYGLLDIDFRGDAHGDIRIGCCSFSGAYSPAVCRTMSALDAGLLAGLSGGERLEFIERITEGYACCRARLLPAEARA